MGPLDHKLHDRAHPLCRATWALKPVHWTGRHGQLFGVVVPTDPYISPPPSEKGGDHSPHSTCVGTRSSSEIGTLNWQEGH